MIVKRLYELSQKLEADGVLPPVGYSPLAVHHSVYLDACGHFESLVSSADPKGQVRNIPLGGRTSQVLPYLLTDVTPYALGMADPKFWASQRKNGKTDKEIQEGLDAKHAVFVALALEWAATATEPAAQGLAAFLQSPEEVAKARASMNSDKCTLQRVMFYVGGVPVQDLPSVREFWANKLDDAVVSTGIHAPCMITGKVVEVQTTHPGNAMVGGGKAHLISANCDSFSVYGMNGCTDTPMAPEVIRGYKRALTWLAGRYKQNQYSLGDMMCLFWTDTGSELNLDPFSPDEDQVRALLESVKKGKKAESPNPGNVYLLMISLNASRIMIHEWFEGSFDAFEANMVSWFARQEYHTARAQGLFGLTRPLFPGNNPVPFYASQGILQAAIGGQRVPFDFLGRSLNIVSKPHTGGDGKNHVRNCPRNVLAMVRLATNDYHQGAPIMSTHNPNETRPAYVCGRMLALLELIQRAALGNVGTTVADTFYSAAAQNPGRILPDLLAKARQAHLPKLRKNRPGAYYNLEAMLLQCFSIMDSDTIPNILTPVEQGMFAMGFHLTLAEDSGQRAAWREKVLQESTPDP